MLTRLINQNLCQPKIVFRVFLSGRILACKADVFWSAIHGLFSGMTLSHHLGFSKFLVAPRSLCLLYSTFHTCATNGESPPADSLHLIILHCRCYQKPCAFYAWEIKRTAFSVAFTRLGLFLWDLPVFYSAYNSLPLLFRKVYSWARHVPLVEYGVKIKPSLPSLWGPVYRLCIHNNFVCCV